MLTVLEAINLSTEYLNKKKIESPRINAELLLAHTLSCRRIDLYLSFDRPLDDEEIKTYREFIRRRSKSEPLQYILGKIEFYGIEFKVNPSVLIPRQETEILVDTIINSVSKEQKINILDVGTGSGNIAVALAKHLSNSCITSIDVSEAALNTARENATANNILERIRFLNHNINSEELLEENFNIIVSNPPYISKDDFPWLKDELKVYEPKDALTDFSDGLNYFRIITSKSRMMLKENGKIYFEAGEGQVEEVRKILVSNNFSEISVVKDYLKIDRVISGVKQ